MSNENLKVHNSLIGAAGVHFVVFDLSLRGLIALPTTRNTAGVDVVVTTLDGSWHANLQVKTSRNRVSFWPVGYSKTAGRNVFYVFLRYLKNERRFEAFLEGSDKVLVEVDAETKRCHEQGNKPWSPCWLLPKQEHEQERLRRQWLEFGLLFV